MNSDQLLELVDQRDFRTLFIEELGWNNPDHKDTHYWVAGDLYTLTNVASFKGLRIWHCPQLPPRPVQREIDVLVGRDTLERLVIFTSEHKQEWRWPRRSQLGAANAKLLAHAYIPGDPNYRTLAQRLEAIELDFDEDISLVTLLDRMRTEFDQEAETASAQAARLMGSLYTELEQTGVDEYDATLLLARLLFLLFGDDADMWSPAGLFETFLREHTTAESLHNDLADLFDALDTEENKRKLPADSPYQRFRYINGGLFKDRQNLPPLTSSFRWLLLESCAFDWSIISPAIFGGMFQTVKSKEARREAGEHYTSEKNILKTIGPLFLDDYRARLGKAKNSKRELTKLHNELGTLQYLDPACGCGNFLIVAYREMRALELELLKLRRDLDLADPAQGPAHRAQLTFDVSSELKVTLNQFHGFEISEWPARIAETAMLLVDHLANQQMSEEFGIAPERLPIRITARITHANALELDWSAALPVKTGRTWIFGNPPFIGKSAKSKAQVAEIKAVWGKHYTGYLDYVTAWHKKSADLMDGRDGRFAFVTTNSICQGQQAYALFGPLRQAGWRIGFAHRTFAWDSEAPGKAAVHCVIVGFTRDQAVVGRLWDYPDLRGEPVETTVEVGVNAYLVDGPDVLVERRNQPLSPTVRPAQTGSFPADGGHFTVTAEQYDEVYADPVARKYLRPYKGSRELLHSIPRWCLWLKRITAEDRKASPILSSRLEGVREFRLGSANPGTHQMANRPHLYVYDGERHEPYLCLPSVVSENRPYFLAARLGPEVIVTNLAFTVVDPDGLQFGLASSSMFLAWQKAIGGRLKSDLRFGNTLTWNNFPAPELDSTTRERITTAAAGVFNARALHPNRTLAKAYDPLTIDTALLEAHENLDREVDIALGASRPLSTEKQRLEVLFDRYRELTRGVS